MARKKKPPKPEEGPAWLVTFTDMMTLMLTFFVLLVSMSTLDERRRLVVLGSIIGTFGEGTSHELLATRDTRRTVEPGPMEMDKSVDMEPLKPRVWEDVQKDLDFAQNKFVQIFSINADLLFAPREVKLTRKGEQFLESLLPVLFRLNHPLLVAGHSSSLRDEMDLDYRVADTEAVVDPSWRLSFGRTMSVYRFFLDSGMDSKMLRMEAFGRFHPRFGDINPEDRRRNRRVDLVLDRRNTQWLDRMGSRPKAPDKNIFKYKNFIFKFDEPETAPAPATATDTPGTEN